MATRTIHVDDLDGTETTEENPVLTWQFSFGPRNAQETYTIDLTEQNFDKLREALDPFTKVAVKVEGRSASVASGERRGRASSRSQEDRDLERKSKADRAALREEIVAWARSNGHPINESGRGRPVRADVMAAFYKANPKAEKLYAA